ncbi:MAG: hypothetical protein H6642_06125 [Caldilineaceae bacterium]|nr:hypothetical protein [Caldilineaceae bacterium]
MNRRKWTIGCLSILGLLIVFIGSLVLISFTATRPIAELSRNFLTALSEENYAAAFRMMTESRQAELGSAENLQQGITANGVRPDSWTLSSRRIENGVGSIDGDVDFADGRAGTVRFRLLREDNRWKVDAFALEPN